MHLTSVLTKLKPMLPLWAEKERFQKVPKYFNFGLLCSPGTLVFKMGLLVLWLSAAAPLCTQTWRTVTQKLPVGCAPWKNGKFFAEKTYHFAKRCPNKLKNSYYLRSWSYLRQSIECGSSRSLQSSFRNENMFFSDELDHFLILLDSLLFSVGYSLALSS